MENKDLVILPIEPTEDVKAGLLCLFEEDTETTERFAFADVVKGQREYPLPDDVRKIKGIYLKIL